MKLIVAVLVSVPAWGANYTCTSSGAGNLSNPSKWTGCNGTYPHNNGADQYAVIANHAITQDVSNVAVGWDNGPVNGYVEVTQNNAGSGYGNCSGGAISGGTAIRAATTVTRIVNGTCQVILTDRGFYSAGPPTIGAVTTSNVTVTGASTVKGNPTALNLVLNSGIWRLGSTQSITISGATGAGWTGLNATWTATVTSIGQSSGGPTVVTIPFDSSALTGTPGGTIMAAPGVAASYTLNYVAGGGTPAIKVGTAGTFTLGPSTATTVSGDVQCAGGYLNVANCLVWNGTGATAASPTTLATAGSNVYTVGIPANTSYPYRAIRTTACAQNAGDSSLPGNCGYMGNATYPTRLDFVGGHTMVLDGLYLKWVGDEHSPAIYHSSSTGDGAANPISSITNSLFDACGRVWHRDNAAVPSTFDHNSFINTARSIAGPTATINLEINSGGAVTPNGGVAYSLQRNGFDANVGAANPITAAGLKGYTIQNNSFGGGINGGGVWSLWTVNFIRQPFWISGVDADKNLENAVFTPGANVGPTYIWIDADSIVNPHTVVVPSTNLVVDGLIYGFSGSNLGDSGEVVLANSGTAANGMTVQNSVFLCDASGVGSSEMTSAMGAVTSAGYTYTFLHNTWCGGYGSFGAVQLNETGPTNAGSITFKSNLIWSKTPNTALKMNSQSTASIADACSPLSNCDYNGSYNGMATPPACTGCANMGKAYQGKWSATPGAHDVDGANPNFVDSTRKVENFDQKYLGKPLAPAWSSSGTYARYDIASNTHASMYSGEALNYVCMNPAGCTGLGAPGVPGTAWRADWGFAGPYWVQKLNYAGAQFTDATIGCAGCYVVQALNNWVTAGFAPRSAAFKGKAHDGGDIGAVVALIANRVPLLMLRGAAIW